MASEEVRPVETLRDFATSLEAAMAVALADPKKPAVHKLRALVRRLEAQVELLRQIDALPTNSAEAKKLNRQLRRLRRAAGNVRNLDVQRKMLTTKRGLPKRAAGKLREELKAERGKKAKKLQRVILKHLPRIAGAIEQLVQSVGTANGMTIPPLQLLPLIERWKQSQKDEEPSRSWGDEKLHGARKVAKAARYMAETASDSLLARHAAKRYETEQQTGGDWHDWLDLSETARKHFGKKHPLTQAAVRHTEIARRKYLKTIR